MFYIVFYLMQNTEPRKYKVKRDWYSRKCYKSAFQIKRRRCWLNCKRIHIFNIVIKIENAPDLMQAYMKCNNFFTIPKCLSVSNNSRSSCALDHEKRIVLIKNPLNNVKTTVSLNKIPIYFTCCTHYGCGWLKRYIGIYLKQLKEIEAMIFRKENEINFVYRI